MKLIRPFLVTLALYLAVAVPLSRPADAQATWMPVACTMVPCPGVDANFVDNWYWVQGTGYVSYSTLFSHARASAETCINAVGFITYATSGNPCVTSAGLQIWEARTNLRSNSGVATAWGSNSNVTTADQSGVPAPDGTSTSVVITATLSNGFAQANFSTTGAITYFDGCYIRFGSGLSFTSVLIGNTLQSSGGINTTISWLNGVPTIAGAIVTPAANGWYRVGVPITTSANGAGFARFALSNSGDTGYLWGVQAEVGSFPSPYIPTTSGTASRAADIITATGALDTLLRGAAASVLVKAGPTPNFANFPRVIGASTLAQGLPVIGATNALVGIYNGTTNLTATVVDISVAPRRMGVSWAPSSRSVVGSGGVVFADANSQLASATYFVGGTNFSAGNPFDGNEQRLFVYGSQLPNATLQSLSGGSW